VVVKSISVLFNVQHLYYLPQFLPVAKAMKTRGGFDIFFSATVDSPMTDYSLIKRFILNEGWQIIDAENEAERRRKILNRRFDITLFGKSTRAGDYCSENTLAVLLYHGIGVKSCYYTDYDPRIDVRYVEGDYRVREFEKRNLKTQLVVTGFPKLDALFDPEEIQKATKDLKFDNNRPIILYAPTFYPSSIEPFGEGIGELTKSFNLIVKLHHFSWTLRKYRHQKDLFLQLADEYENLRLLPVESFNIVPYFSIASVLMTEASSTAFEFLATGKPVVVCDFLHLRWKHHLFNRRFRRDRMDDEIIRQLDFAVHAPKPEDAESAVTRALDSRNEIGQSYGRKRDDFLGIVDGQASRRVVEDLLIRMESRR